MKSTSGDTRVNIRLKYAQSMLSYNSTSSVIKGDQQNVLKLILRVIVGGL